MTAGALVVLAAAAKTRDRAARRSTFARRYRGPCTNAPRATCPTHVLEGDGPRAGGPGGGPCRRLGIVALLRSGGETPRPPAAGRSPTGTLDATQAGDVATPHKRRMSDAALLTLIVVASVIAV